METQNNPLTEAERQALKDKAEQQFQNGCDDAACESCNAHSCNPGLTDTNKGMGYVLFLVGLIVVIIGGTLLVKNLVGFFF